MSLLYFAYGSNLHGPQMERRCPGATLIGTAYLEHHKLIFAGSSKNWRGAGVAEFRPSSNDRLFGLLYELTQEHYELLDEYEGTYNRVQITVMASDKEIEVYTYTRKTQREVAEPSHRYVALMAHAYGSNGFDISSLLRAIEDSSK